MHFMDLLICRGPGNATCLARMSCAFRLLVKGERCLFELAKLLHETLIGISSFSLCFDKLESIFEFHGKQAHNEHDDTGGRS